MGTLDTKINAASAAEATYNTDVVNVTAIQAGIVTATTSAQTGIDTATAPLAPAQALLATDAVAFNNALQDLSTAALASQVPVPGTTAS